MRSPAQVRLYNTLTRSVETLDPLHPNEVGLYCCGPTVYDFQHIGNMRTYIFEDVLVRMLKRAGYKVRHVMNITDVGHLVSDADEGEDKMLVAARREKKKSMEIAEHYTKIFFEDCAKLDIRRPDIVCKATDHITQMIELIKRIEAHGFSYVSGGNVYFDVSKLPDYGKLARLDLEKLLAGARVDVDDNKRHPADFGLWSTKSKFENQELLWDSPWGRGYPGWHLECSAMSMHYLGDHFDIHCGGIDHVPVHHTNELAQSEAAICNHEWVRVWMHGEFLVLKNKEKMSKSLGNFITVGTLIEHGVDPMAYRFMCLSAHYRTQLAFSWESLEGAASGLASLKRSVLALKDEASGSAPSPATSERAASFAERFDETIFNDLNAPQAMAVVWSVLSDKELSAAEKLSLLYSFDEVLGLEMKEWKTEEAALPAEIQELVNQRQKAREQKNWAESDALRNELKERGYTVEDKGGTMTVRKV